MDIPIAVVYLAVFGFIRAAVFIDDRRRAMVDPWHAAARAAGLKEVQVKYGLGSAVLRGRKGSFSVELSRSVAYRERMATDVVIGGLPRALTLKMESAGASSGRGGGSRDVELGDAGFDSEVYLHGSPALCHALMDVATRARVRSMVRTNAVEVQSGELHATVHDEYTAGPGTRITVVLPLLLEFAEVLVPPADVVERLVANARHDPAPGVRVANLLMLARDYPDHPETRPALSAALADPDDEVRLRAALLTPEGGPVLLEIAGGQETDDSCAGRAITALGRQLAPERVLAILAQALRSRRIQTASACLAWLGRFRPPDSAAMLAKVLAREGGPLAEAAARALGEYGRPETESALIAALEHESAPVRLAAVEALGAGGSVGAVEPLQQAETDRTADGSFRRAARQAIAAIQARAGSASPGQLTLSEGESGRLSLEGDAAGHVSLAPAGDGGPPAAGE